jgi:hypothetical protein
LEAFSEAIMKLQKLPEFNVVLDHMKAIKDYFLLCKGEFYQTFLEEARQIMALPP